MKTITGTWQQPDGSAIANGILRLKLSGDAVVTGTSQIAPNDIVITLNGSGAIPASTQIYANDELTPTGTIYYVSVSTSAGAQVFGTEQWSISGGSPINLNNMTPASNGVSYPSPLSSVALSMPGEFSVSGSPLVANGTITVTKANESANTVWSGPTSGGAASPTFRALVDADVAGVTHLRTNLTIPAVTDTIVGKATTDTLSNKTLTGSSSGNSVTLLNVQNTTGTLTGNSADQTIYTYTMPANTMRVGSTIRIQLMWSRITGSTANIVKIFFGATDVSGATVSSSVTGTGSWSVFLTATGTSTQDGVNAILTYGGAISNPGGTVVGPPTENITGSIVIKATFNVTNASTLKGLLWLVELVQ